MADHLTAEQIRRYGARAMTPAERIEISDHLAVCETCRQSLSSTRRTESAAPEGHHGDSGSKGVAEEAVVQVVATEMRSGLQEEPPHLTYEEMAGYVDGGASGVEREIVEGHLQHCAPCREEVRDLQAFRAVLSTAPDTPLQPTGASTRLPFGERLKALFAPLRPGLALRWTGAAAAVILAFAVGRTSRPGLPPGPTEAEIQRRILALKQDRDAREATLRQEQKVLADRARKAENALLTAQRKTQGPQPLLPTGDYRNRPVEVSPGNYVLLTPIGKAEKKVLDREQISLSAGINELMSDTPHYMGGPNEPSPMPLKSPVGTFVQTTRPKFVWESVSGAATYEITLQDLDSNTLETGKLTGTAWTPRRKTLQKGQTYKWSVTALDNAGVALPHLATEAFFQVLTDAEATKVDRALQRYGDSQLLRGIVFANNGLLDEAEAAFRAALKTDPADKKATALLKDLRIRRERREGVKG